MDVTYISNYYEEMIEKILREGLKEDYKEKQKVFLRSYNEFWDSLTDVVMETIDELMEDYEMREAQILKKLYIQGALDAEEMNANGNSPTDCVKILESGYSENKKRIYEDVSKALNMSETIRDAWSLKHFSEEHIYKKIFVEICDRYERLMKQKESVSAAERKDMYLQGVLDRSRMPS